MLQMFCNGRGVTPEEYTELSALVHQHAPSLVDLLEHMKPDHFLLCDPQWCAFVKALACPSPVCALIHPSDELFTLLHRLQTEDITRDSQAMERLQNEVPVLFDLLQSLNYHPARILSPVIDVLISKAMAPFSCDTPQSQPSTSGDSTSALAFFPHLPVRRLHGRYTSERASENAPKCYKQSRGHPSLLPGIFTLFCEHGMVALASYCTGHAVYMVFNSCSQGYAMGFK